MGVPKYDRTGNLRTVSNLDTVVHEGLRDNISVLDENALSLLQGIYKELVKINLHLSCITDNNIDDADMEI